MSERDYADLIREAAKTIRHLQSENERLEKNDASLRRTCLEIEEHGKSEIERLQAENEGLRAEINRLLGTNG